MCLDAPSVDWSPTGSFNMREEIKFARQVMKDSGVALSSEALWRMATIRGAYALGLEDRFGGIGPRRRCCRNLELWSRPTVEAPSRSRLEKPRTPLVQSVPKQLNLMALQGGGKIVRKFSLFWEQQVLLTPVRTMDHKLANGCVDN